MLNIVEKYSADTAVESEDGVVAIEYVVVAGGTSSLALAAICRTVFGDDARRPSCTTIVTEHRCLIRTWGEGDLPPTGDQCS